MTRTEENGKFVFSDEFRMITSPKLHKHCIHLYCKAGEGSFLFSDRCFHFREGDLVILVAPAEVSNPAPHPDLSVEFFSADLKYLHSLEPSNSYSIGGGISLYEDPVIPLSADNAQRFLDDIHRLRDRMGDTHYRFYHELMASLCLTMIYDNFEFHALYCGSSETTQRASFVVKELMRLLASGECRTERSVDHYAQRLTVTSKYLSNTVRRVTGRSVMSYIDRYAVPMLKEMLDDERLSLQQIAERMNFSSLSYFSRYCTKHLGQSPAQYRRSLQPSGGKATRPIR